MRLLISLVLLSSLVFLPRSAIAADSCPGGGDQDSGIGLVQEAYNLLSVLYVDRLPPADLLQPAFDALQSAASESMENDDRPSPTMAAVAIDRVDDWPVFASGYCAVWSETQADLAQDLSYTAIRAMARGVAEGHTRFLTPQMYSDHQAWAAGDMRYDGIGARLRGNPLGVQYVFPGSPAEEAGLMFGDDIIAIDGDPVSDLSAAEAVRLVRGESGTNVRLTIERPGTIGRMDIQIARASVKMPIIESRMIGELGYMRLQGFPSADLPNDVRDTLLRLRDSNARGLILDLRGNSGGRLDVGTKIAAYFLPPEAPVYQQTTRRGQSTTTTTGSDPIWDRPMVTLVNEGTASMGEILAAALQEQGVTQVLGATTSGSVAGSIVVPMADGSALQVTTLRIESGLGVRLNTIGVHPDIAVEQSVADAQAMRDRALDTAVDLLRTRLADRSSQPSENAPVPAVTGLPAGSSSLAP